MGILNFFFSQDLFCQWLKSISKMSASGCGWWCWECGRKGQGGFEAASPALLRVSSGCGTAAPGAVLCRARAAIPHLLLHFVTSSLPDLGSCDFSLAVFTTLRTISSQEQLCCHWCILCGWDRSCFPGVQPWAGLAAGPPQWFPKSLFRPGSSLASSGPAGQTPGLGIAQTP